MAAREDVVEAVHVSPLREKAQVDGVVGVIPSYAAQFPDISIGFGLLTKMACEIDERLAAFEGGGVSSEFVSGHHFDFPPCCWRIRLETSTTDASNRLSFSKTRFALATSRAIAASMATFPAR